MRRRRKNIENAQGDECPMSKEANVTMVMWMKELACVNDGEKKADNTERVNE